MSGLDNFSEGLRHSYAQLPDKVQKTFRVFGWGCVFLVAVLTIVLPLGRIALESNGPPSEADLQAEQRQIEIDRMRVEHMNASRASEARANAQIDIEHARAAAERVKLGLPAGTRLTSTAPLADLFEIATTHLSTILTVMFACYLLPTFASTGDPWRLALNIAAAIVLAGTVSLYKNITSPTTVEMRVTILDMSVSTASVGLCLMLFGTLLAGFCLWRRSRK